MHDNLSSVNGTPLSESLANKGLGSLRDNFLEKQHPFDKTFLHDTDLSDKYLDNDNLDQSILCMDNIASADEVNTHPSHHRNDGLIDKQASSVNAKFDSCHVGETIIPAVKEKTQVQQAASYSSDQAAAYLMKGLSNNNYKLSGSLSKKECEVAKGGRQTEETLSMCGNMSKKYCQRGNKALLNCNCGTDENLDGFGLGS